MVIIIAQVRTAGTVMATAIARVVIVELRVRRQ
jgi:hypothetical protein